MQSLLLLQHLTPALQHTSCSLHGLLLPFTLCVCMRVASEWLNVSASWTHSDELFHVCFATAAMKCLQTTVAV